MTVEPLPTAANDDDYPAEYPPVMREIAEVISRTLRAESGIDEVRAKAIGEVAAEAVRDAFGGQQIYLPKGRTLVQLRRYAEIYEAFDGTNHAELAQRFGMSTRNIYRAVVIMRRLRSKRNQGDFFE